MAHLNKGKLFLRAALRALIASAEELPMVGVPAKMGAAFWDHWVAGLKAAQEAVPETERPAQLEQAARRGRRVDQPRQPKLGGVPLSDYVPALAGWRGSGYKPPG